MNKIILFKTLVCRVLPCMAIAMLATACDDDDKEVVIPTGDKVTEPVNNNVKGVYILSEGAFGKNQASLDYFDATTGYYAADIYASRNDSVVLELGDVGNDAKVFDGRLYAVINNSNKVEVMDASTARRITQININGARYITADDNNLYVSAYGAGAPGSIYKIDPVSNQITGSVTVGYEPEELAIASGKLYVANSGGYMTTGQYERTVSVIDPSTFTVIKNIDVDVNLHRLRADGNGYIYVSSRGNYYDIPSSLYVINSANDQVIKHFDCIVADLDIYNGKVYYYGSSYDANWVATYKYGTIDTNSLTASESSFITDGTQSEIVNANGIAVNPANGDIYVADAAYYTSTGTVYCYSNDGKLKWSHASGIVPGHFAFVNR